MKQERTIKLLLTGILLSNICYAVYCVMFGSLATPMMAFYGIDKAAQGMFTSACSIGGVACALFCAFFGERFKKPLLMIPGIVFVALASLLMFFAPPYEAVCAIALIGGLGYTFIDIMGQATVTEYFPERTNAILPVLQIFYGIGAFVGPMLLVLPVRESEPQTFTLACLYLGIASAVVAVIYIWGCKSSMRYLPKVDTEKMKIAAKKDPVGIFRSWKAWMLLLSCTLFNCFTTSFIAWAPTYYHTERGMDFESSAFVLTAFYLGLVIMRFFGPKLFKKARPYRIFIIYALITTVFFVLSYIIQDNTVSTVMIGICGAFRAFGMVCTTMTATQLFPERKASAASISVFAYSIGGAVAPVFVGTMAESYGFTMPFVIVTVLLAMSAVTMMILARRSRDVLG